MKNEQERPTNNGVIHRLNQIVDVYSSYLIWDRFTSTKFLNIAVFNCVAYIFKKHSIKQVRVFWLPTDNFSTVLMLVPRSSPDFQETQC
jgi:hypothetical protein